MPLYEYGCENCGKITEVMQKFSDAPLATCPECEAPVQKLMSRTSFQLKGTGWYSTDYKKKVAPASSPTPEASATSSTANSNTASTASSNAASSVTQTVSTGTSSGTPANKNSGTSETKTSSSATSSGASSSGTKSN